MKHHEVFLSGLARFTVGLLALSIAAFAQIGRGTLTGTISDPSGAGIPSAAITVTHSDTGIKVNGQSGNVGNFYFASLVPGSYEIEVSASGFRDYAQRGVTVSVGDTVTANIALQVGATTDKVVVTAEAPQLKSDTSEISTAVASDYILNLPLTVEGTVRNPVYFMSLVPGYTGEVVGGFWANKVNGGQWYGTDIFVDGSTIQLTRPSIPSFNYGVSVDAVQEF